MAEEDGMEHMVAGMDGTGGHAVQVWCGFWEDLHFIFEHISNYFES